MNDPSTTTPTSDGQLDVVNAIWQLRVLVCGLGGLLLILSVAFNLLVWKQNRNLTAAINNRDQQVSQMENRARDITRFANDLALYSQGKPEYVAIFRKNGIELKSPEADAVGK